MNNKKLIFGVIICIAIASLAFTSVITKDIIVKESSIKWNAYKVTGEHYGTILLKEGVLKFEDDILTGGSFIVDMTSLTVDDQKGMKKKFLIKHLKSDDFFDVKNHTTSNLTFTEVLKTENSYAITANLTIKGITKPVTFNMNIQNNSATAKLKINRTHYNIKYRSTSFFQDLKNKAINDDFDLEVKLTY